VLFNGLQCIQAGVLETPYQQLYESFFCYKPVPANLTCIISLTKKVTYQVITTFFACLSAHHSPKHKYIVIVIGMLGRQDKNEDFHPDSVHGNSFTVLAKM
jgi:hypothetical protein